VAALQQIFGAKAAAGDISRLAPDQMLVSSDTAKARNLTVGSTVPVQLSRGEARTYTVSGIYESSQLTNPVTLPLSATGSGGMQAMVDALVHPGDVVVVGINGLFGERMADAL
ncbi:hypothetical protein ACXYTC_21035, partial [Escherichia coli]